MKVIRSKTVKSFLEKIAPINIQDNTLPVAKYIFRGQGDSKWSLLPSVFRAGTKTPGSCEVVQSTCLTYREQRKLEWEVLKSFVLELNSNGFYLPNESLFYKLTSLESHTEEYNLFTRMEKAWPSQEYYSLLALGQHFGLPTRLMDWTYCSYIAAYFAAKTCVRLQENGQAVKSLSVYALNMKSFLLKNPEVVEYNINNIHKSTTPIVTYHVVETPSYFNNNLKSQRGLFVCCTEYGNVSDNKFLPTPLTDYICEELASIENKCSSASGCLAQSLRDCEEKCIMEFRLSSAHAKELLFELDKMFINESAMFPSVVSCIQTLYERLR